MLYWLYGEGYEWEYWRGFYPVQFPLWTAQLSAINEVETEKGSYLIYVAM